MDRSTAMTDPRRLLVPLAVAGALATAPLLVPHGAAAQTTGEQVAKKIAAGFGVRVLKVRESQIDGRAVFLVTVMNPGGDFDEAFQIITLAVDVKTGKLVSGFRHRSSGQRGNQAPSYQTSR